MRIGGLAPAGDCGYAEAMRLRSTLGLLLVFGVACGDEEPAPAFDLRLTWRTCAWQSGGDDAEAECATARVPDRWSAPDGATLELFVKRRRAAGGARGQLWLLAGGPGVDGAFFETLWPHYAPLAAELDVYLLDHRGTGRSSRLSCPDEEEPGSPGGMEVTTGELAGCAAYLRATWGARLEAFRPSEAAHDVQALIDALRAPGDEVFVYGRSYGTYLLHRYLQVAPGQASGVIFDSSCGPTECAFPAFFDLGHADAGELLLAHCDTDPVCAGRLPNPSAALASLLDDLDRGHCAALGWGAGYTRRLLALMLRDRTVRQYIPATIRRLQRCAGSDVQALQRLTAAFFAAPDPAPATLTLRSMVLRDHIVFSEMWREPTGAELAALADASFDGGATAGLGPLYADWPRYQADALVDGRAASGVPVLMLHGGLDPQTPLAAAASLRALFDGPAQRFVQFPFAPHGIVDTTVTAAGGETCGTAIVGDFLAAPAAAPATGCAATAAALDFAGEASVSTWLFGVSDPWGG